MALVTRSTECTSAGRKIWTEQRAFPGESDRDRRWKNCMAAFPNLDAERMNRSSAAQSRVMSVHKAKDRCYGNESRCSRNRMQIVTIPDESTSACWMSRTTRTPRQPRDRRPSGMRKAKSSTRESSKRRSRLSKCIIPTWIRSLHTSIPKRSSRRKISHSPM